MPIQSPVIQRRFEALLKEHRQIAFHVARMYEGHPDDRHDLVQEICSQLWRAFPGYDEARRFSTWMYRVALNTGITHLRRAGARTDRFEPLSDELLEATGEIAPDPATGERLRELDALIAQLDPLSRALILLYLEERPYAEIAEILGISEPNVATKISRIKQRFRQQITDDAATKEQAWNSMK